MVSFDEDFFNTDFLETDYVQRYRKSYEKMKNCQFPYNPYRNYKVLLDSLNSIYYYKKEHSNSFTKRIKSEKDNRNREAVFAEIIVYAYYVKLFYEGIIKSLDIRKDDYDLRIEISNGSFHYLEILSIMPDFEITEDQIMIEKTHLIDEKQSVRQKILSKIKNQKQLTKARKNFVVIELNDISIANDFTILSSLSGGHDKVIFNKKTKESIYAGYDWSNSIFKEESMENVKCVIYYFLGDYNKRKFIFNPNFKGKCSTGVI